MRLQPGSLRELHWHTNAAELGYVVSGSCRTTVLSPDGAATDTFGPSDVWDFPRGWGHSILGIGPSECHFILIFDNGDFAEEHTLSITDWLAHTSPAVVSQSLGLGMESVAKLPKGELILQRDPFMMILSRVLRPSRSRHFDNASLSIGGPAAATRAGRRRAVEGYCEGVSDLGRIVRLRAGSCKSGISDPVTRPGPSLKQRACVTSRRQRRKVEMLTTVRCGHAASALISS